MHKHAWCYLVSVVFTEGSGVLTGGFLLQEASQRSRLRFSGAGSALIPGKLAADEIIY